MAPLERAARALNDLLPDQFPALVEPVMMPLNWKTKEAQAPYYEVARAVLAAIREPSEKMQAVAAEMAGFNGYYGDDPDNRAAASEVWQAMIDAALEEV